jgi:hypothetical protein
VPPRAKRVREPIQVYLTGAERTTLDRLARELGVSRAEVLRRGIEMLGSQRARSFHEVFDTLVGALSVPGAATDLAERHDDHAADDADQRTSRSRRRSS